MRLMDESAIVNLGNRTIQAGGPGSGRRKGGSVMDQLHNVATKHGFVKVSSGTGVNDSAQYKHADGSKLGVFGDGSWRHAGPSTDGNGTTSLSQHLGSMSAGGPGSGPRSTTPGTVKTFCTKCNDTKSHDLDPASTDDAFTRYSCNDCGHVVRVPNENRD
jgi:hypothetical protein